MVDDRYGNLVGEIGINFTDPKLLERVFIHRSYLNENRGRNLEHNERMEFLGDAVLELVVTEYLYNKYHEPEGVLTNWRSAIVRGKSLSDESKKLHLDDYLMTSRGEAKNEGKAKDLLLANCFEALIGAIYLDQGYDTTSKFIETYLIYKLPEIVSGGQYIDPKGRFQELSQEKWAITPLYKVISESGPDHNKHFEVGLYLNDKLIAKGEGASKQTAQVDSAKNALEVWDEIVF
jgi:ribonuclease-3